MRKKLSLLLAALFMAASVQTASALDYDEDAPAPVISLHSEEEADAIDDADDDADATHPLSLGHPYHWRRGMMKGHGPQRMPGANMMPGMRMRGGPGHMRGFGGMGMMRELDLTTAQKTQMIDAMVDNYRQRLTLRMEMADTMQKLRDEYESGNPNRDNIVSLNQKMGELKGKIEVLGHEYVEKVQSMLTPDQKEKIKGQMEKFEKRMKDGRRWGRGDRGPGFDRGPGKGPRGPKDMRGPGPRMMDDR